MRFPDAMGIAMLAASGLSACGASGEQAKGDRAPSSLESSARAAGVITDLANVAPDGLFQRQHEAGKDSLCLVPLAGQRYRFGMEVNFGAKEYCRGGGTARRAGDKLVLQFSGKSGCFAVADYEGDRVAMPGVTDRRCAALCTKATLDGVSFPRLTSDEAAARAVFDRQGQPLCGV